MSGNALARLESDVTHATLLAFAQANDQAAATTKKLQKQTTLANYFRTIEDDAELSLAVRYAGGRAFSPTDERVLGASGAIVSDVVAGILRVDWHRFREQSIKSGEMGEAIAIFWPERAIRADESAEPVTLNDLADAFDDLASTGNQEHKKEILGRLFVRCRDPREAAYLAKIIFGDLRTGVREGVLQAAVAEAFEKPLAQVQRCQLLVGDLDEVAKLAKHDQLCDARFKLFHPIQFMLATPKENANELAETFAGRTFYAEDKLDGIRAQVHKSADRIAIYTRTLDRIDESFPDVVAKLSKLPGEFLLDGEIVPWRDGRVLPFAHIQRRLGRKVLTKKILNDNPCEFIAFDILYRDGELLMEKPLAERRSFLTDLAGCLSSAEAETRGGQLLTTALTNVVTAIDIEGTFNIARSCRNEGLVLKDPQSIYSPGRRGQMWFKLKTYLPTFDCVVTAAEYGHGKRRGTLSDYTFAVWNGDELVNVGKAYSGVTDEEIAQLTELFHQLSRGNNGHVHLVEPKVVLEIACDQIQKSERHASGYALRFPRIKRIRWDKSPADADRLERIIEIYESTHNFAKCEGVEEATPQPAPEPTLFDHLA
jgi:DNA ligase-1